jgi:hypothetical protein
VRRGWVECLSAAVAAVSFVGCANVSVEHALLAAPAATPSHSIVRLADDTPIPPDLEEVALIGARARVAYKGDHMAVALEERARALGCTAITRIRSVKLTLSGQKTPRHWVYTCVCLAPKHR